MRTAHVITTVDTHTGGEPTRTVTGGLPPIPGKTIQDKIVYLKNNLDWVRTALMLEPRGHSGMSGVILTESTSPAADIGVIFLETFGYVPLCGHGTMGACTALVETGMVEVREPVTHLTLDTPAGLARVSVAVENGTAKSVTIRTAPSFVFAADAVIDLPVRGEISVDVAYGGNVYAILSAESAGVTISPGNAAAIIEKGKVVRNAVNDCIEIQHPELADINTCTHVEFIGLPSDSSADAKNAVFFADDWIDRSPCGTGTAARVAVLCAKGRLKLGEELVHESILGTLFSARAVEKTCVGSFDAIVSDVTGSAHVTGIHQFFIDPDDPHGYGFLLR